ncbi:MAG: (2Fe-2S) ferredoxin domain-containing protein [Sphaerobacter sp.]|nr:(2Fe-2S) ferredoxin domain-containing protein [Sphaerobacter sp.]
MYWTRKHVLICTAQHCNQKGAQAVAGRLRIELKRKGLDVDVMANTCDSIDLCDIGPNIVVYPDGIIYHSVQAKDIPELVESLRPGGTPVERLRLYPRDGAEQARRELYEAAVRAAPISPEAFLALAQARGWDEAWVNEQARRGFIARKEIDGRPVITVTSKALNRYGIAASPSEEAAGA